MYLSGSWWTEDVMWRRRLCNHLPIGPNGHIWHHSLITIRPKGSRDNRVNDLTFLPPRMWCGHALVVSVCLSVSVCVCVSVCLSPCLSVCNTLTFERVDLERSFLECRYIFRIVRPSSYNKVIKSRSRSQEQKACLCILQSCTINIWCYDCVCTAIEPTLTAENWPVWQLLECRCSQRSSLI